MICYWDKMESPIGPIHLAATGAGLVYCSTPCETEARLLDWVAKHLPGYTCRQGTNEFIALAKQQLAAYFSGHSRLLNVPLQLIGTPFQRSVWQALMTIPYGESRTYGEIAQQIGRPQAQRAVGQANNRNPISFFVP